MERVRSKTQPDQEREPETQRRTHFPIIEIFGPTIQGEGSVAGKTSHFIRFGGCSYRCSWCDSMHAVDPVQIKKNAKWLIPSEIVDQLQQLPPASMVTLSGGDPVMWDLTDLVKKLHQAKFSVALETQGALYRDWVADCDWVTVSPKPPSSGMSDRIDMKTLMEYICLGGICNPSFKIVCFDKQDIEYAINITRWAGKDIPIYLSVGTDQWLTGMHDGVVQEWICAKYSWLAEEVLKTPELKNVTVLPQLHVLLFGTKQGV